MLCTAHSRGYDGSLKYSGTNIIVASGPDDTALCTSPHRLSPVFQAPEMSARAGRMRSTPKQAASVSGHIKQRGTSTMRMRWRTVYTPVQLDLTIRPYSYTLQSDLTIRPYSYTLQSDLTI